MPQMEGKLGEVPEEWGVSKFDLLVHSGNSEGKATWLAWDYETIRGTMRNRI